VAEKILSRSTTAVSLPYINIFIAQAA